MPEILNHFPAPLGSVLDLRVLRLAAGDDHAQPLATGIQVWTQAIDGHVHVCGHELRSGQGVMLVQESVLAAYAETNSLLLIAELKLAP